MRRYISADTKKQALQLAIVCGYKYSKITGVSEGAYRGDTRLSIAYRTKQVTKLKKYNGPIDMKTAVMGPGSKKILKI
jgi:hypothetical protein